VWVYSELVFSRLLNTRLVMLCLTATLWVPAASALDPHKSLTQYSRQMWAQVDGLPQDTIRAIAQTTDGYLWLGTDEGLARFDGIEFTVYDKTDGSLPTNSVTALSADPDGSLWIGTARGLTQLKGKSFHTFTTKDGLPDDTISALYSDHAGALWIVAGVSLCRFQEGRFTNYSPGANLLSVRAIREDPHHDLVVAGFGGVVRISGDNYTTLIDNATVGGDVVSGLLVDRHDNLWVAGSLGLMLRTPNGHVRKFDTHDGLPDLFVRSVVEDRDGNIWIGTNGGLARYQGDRFVASAENGRDSDLVRCLLEDREGDLWVGANNGLTRLRDDAFTVYGKTEGMPSDEPNTVFQDHAGRIWVGFHEGGLLLFSPERRRFTPADGMPDTEVFSIREARNHDLLIATRVGLVRMHDSHFTTVVPPDPLSRLLVFDALEDVRGNLWMAGPAGLFEMTGSQIRPVLPSGASTANAVVTLCETRDGALWAGTFGKGLWRIQGNDTQTYSISSGLSSDNIRELYQDADGTLWIGTFGGGLGKFRDGRFQWFTQQDGLLSDNIANISDDGDSLWLSTTRGLCRISKKQLDEFAAKKRKSLDPTNYGTGDGLRSAQCSPGYPTGGGGDRNLDGRLWFTTSRGLAVFNPAAAPRAPLPPAVHLLEIDADGTPLDLSRPVRLAPDVQRLRFRYTAIHLSAPERVRYSLRLAGLDSGWVNVGGRREINYNPKHGHLVFHVKAEIPGGPSTEQSFAFDVLPHYYETAWFRIFCCALLVAAAWGIYQVRLRRVRYRFALVLGERARLAREIHDTLAQGFVGIASQLDAVSMCIPNDEAPVRKYLDMARRMARHSLTEARRSVMDLRASALEGHDLAGAIQSSTRTWTAGSPVDVAVDVSGPATVLPEETEQHLLRIAQEAVTNVLKHAAASRVEIQLHTEAKRISLRIRDNGRGFEQQGVFSSAGGHFGLIGMRERAERLGGELHLASQPGGGTEVEVTVPIP
jgi:signal transduction histidine kinase/ligand-binding sensor domain-containing protein